MDGLVGFGMVIHHHKGTEQGEQSDCKVDFGAKCFAHQHLCDRFCIRVAILVTVGQPVRARMSRGLY